MEVNHVEWHHVAACWACGQSLDDVAVEAWDLRQGRDLAPIQLTVKEHQAEVKCCP